MSYYILYIDGSQESHRIQNWLQDLGVSVLAVSEERGVRLMPTLEWSTGRLEGSANIELYFERRQRQPVA